MAVPYATAGSILKRVGIQLGIGNPVDPIAEAATDPNWAQLLEFLNDRGQELVRTFEWRQLVKEYNLTTVPGQSRYPLPSDFRDMIDQSGWNRSSRLPLRGPATSQEWQYLKARQVGVTLHLVFRQTPMEIEFFPPLPPAGQQVYFEYTTQSWVQSAANVGNVDPITSAPIPDKLEVNDPADLVLFDDLLMVRAVKLQFRQTKGFDTTADQRDFESTLERVQNSNVGGPILNLTGTRTTNRLLDASNFPETNFGVP